MSDQPKISIPIFDFEKRMIYGRGHQLKLSALEMIIVETLWNKYPKITAKSDLYDAMYPGLRPWHRPKAKIMDVMVAKMRPKLAELGLIISTSWGIGYGFTLGDPSTLEEIKREGFSVRGPRRNRVEKEAPPANAALQRAIGLFGSQQKLSKAIGGVSSQSALSRVVLGEVPLSPAVAKAIELATDFKIRKWELLPDVWDAPEPQAFEPGQHLTPDQ